MDPKALTESVIGAAIKVQKVLGPGLLESAYRQCMAYELRQTGLSVQSEVPLDVRYGDLVLAQAYRLDLLCVDPGAQDR